MGQPAGGWALRGNWVPQVAQMKWSKVEVLSGRLYQQIERQVKVLHPTQSAQR